MNIVSINIAAAQTIRFNDTDVETGIFKQPTKDTVRITKLGLPGDHIVDTEVHGGADQAVYLYHREDYDWWEAQEGKNFANGAFGENLTIEGFTDFPWVVGDRLMINDVILEITAPRVPCFKLAVKMADNSFAKKFVHACRPGAYARVIQEGTISLTDDIIVNRTTKDYAALDEIFIEWHNKTKSRSVLEKALRSPLSGIAKVKIEQWYNELN